MMLLKKNFSRHQVLIHLNLWHDQGTCANRLNASRTWSQHLLQVWHIRIVRRISATQQLFGWPTTTNTLSIYLELINCSGSNEFVIRIQQQNQQHLVDSNTFPRLGGGVKDQNRYSPFLTLSLFLSRKTSTVTQAFPL